jgi:hypothetical protein
MRLFALLLLLTAAPAFAQDAPPEPKPDEKPDTSKEARALYDEVAKQLTGGARLSLKTSATMKTEGDAAGGPGNAKVTGDAHVAGDKLAMRMTMKAGERERGQLTIVSGAELWTQRGAGAEGRAQPIKAGVLPGRFRAIFAMGGFFFAGRFGLRDDDQPLSDAYQVSNFALGKAAPAAEGKALQTITYDFKVKRFPNVAKVMLWIDGSTTLPVKREVRVANRPGAPVTVITETYAGVAVEGDAPAGAFDKPQAPADDKPMPPPPGK